MSNDENHFRKFQRAMRDGGRIVSKRVEESNLKRILVNTTAELGKSATKTYNETGVDKIVKTTSETGKGAYRVAGAQLGGIDNAIGFSRVAKSATVVMKRDVAVPTNRLLAEVGITDVAINVGRMSGEMYGESRGLIKPYFEADDARELLENTQRELTKLTACILQVSYQDAEGWLSEFGRLVSAKVAGVASTATVFGLVSIYGTAGTGTAIASLSGAAATNATLAAVGGIVGGGMVAGALVLSGLGILIGIGAFKLLASEARDFDSLPNEDKQIVNTSGILLAAIQEKLSSEQVTLCADEAELFVEQSLVPFHQFLDTHQDAICSRLDVKNAVSYRQHVLRDFRHVVIDGFRNYVQKAPVSINGLIGGVFYALLTNSALDGSNEQGFVLDALRRSTKGLHDATEAELGSYMQELSPEQLRGVASNVKGIYHEMLHVETYNKEHTDTYAALHADTNHQGSDVQVFSKETGELLNEYQLKATDSADYVREHLDRYPEIGIMVTEEVAPVVNGAESSGFANAEMNSQVHGVFAEVADNSVIDRVAESAEISGLVSTGLAALRVLKGESSVGDAGKNMARTVVNAAAATGITAYLFS